jgi:hypothetical protein
MRRIIFLIFPIFLFFGLSAAGQEVLRGEVRVDLEPVFGQYIEDGVRFDTQTARRTALEEATMLYSAMIYGWSFNYEIGERARGIAEDFELSPLGTIPFGDPGLQATDAEIREARFCLWTDYRMTEFQRRRLRMWRSGTTRNIQALGQGSLDGPPETAALLAVKQAALEDAARAGIRSMLQGMERNRPKEARGYAALAEFPVFRMDSGRLTVSARFRVELTEIQPFAAH